MKSRRLLLLVSVVLFSVTISLSSNAVHVKGQIVCPPTTGALSNAETADVLRTAMNNSDIATVQRMMTYPNFAQLRDLYNQSSPLHMAVAPCDARMVQLVLTHPGFDLSARDIKDRTPLHAAARCGRDVLDQILNLPGADPNVLYSKPSTSPLGSGRNQNRTPLHQTADYGNVAGVTALLEHGARPNPKTSSGFTPLHFAAARNESEITLILLNFGANPNARDDEEGRTPLHSALSPSDFREPIALKLLLADSAADPEAEDDRGWTPLRLAAYGNTEKGALLLLKHGVDPNAEDDNGRTPYTWQLGRVTWIRSSCCWTMVLTHRLRTTMATLHGGLP